MIVSSVSYTQEEVNSFDQHFWRLERVNLYQRVKMFCQDNNIGFVNQAESISKNPHDRVVFMLLFDRIPENNFWTEINQLGKKVTVVTDNIVVDPGLENIKFFSYPQLLGVTASYSDDVVANPNPSKLYNCFIQRVDSARQSWFYFLHNHNLLDQGYVSLLLNQTKEYSDFAGRELFDHNHQQYQLSLLPQFEKAYQELRNIVPYRNFVEEGNLVPLIMDSKYSLVLETYACDDLSPWCFTEKALRALQYPTIPLLFLSKGSNAILESLGFVFAVDLKFLDNLTWQERQQALLQILIDDSIEFDSKKLNDQCQHNRALLRSWKKEYQQDNFFDELFDTV